jgi:hypothetical protein
MDIAGAETLKGRLDAGSADDVPNPSVDIPEDALPVYRWLGISPPSPETARKP